MKKNVIICGLIAGAIVTTWMLISTAICAGNMDADLNKSMWLGYASMLLAFSLIFVGVKNYRDNYNNGMVTFGKAFQIGLYIALIASTIYVVVWLIDYYFFVTDYIEKYSAHVLANMKKSGATHAEISAKTVELANFGKLYKNPFFTAVVTYAEILPLGLVVSLISALILKRKKNKDLPDTNLENAVN